MYLGSEVLPLRHSRFASENSREIKSLIGLHFGSTADATPQAVPIERGRERRSLSVAAVPNAKQPVLTMLILSSEVPDAVVRRAS